MIKLNLTLNEEVLAKLAGLDEDDIIIKNPNESSLSSIELEIFAHNPSAKILMDKLGLEISKEDLLIELNNTDSKIKDLNEKREQLLEDLKSK